MREVEEVIDGEANMIQKLPALEYEEIERIALSLDPSDRLRLAERLLGTATEVAHSNRSGVNLTWDGLRGIAPDLLNGLDAQAWVHQLRSGDDDSLNSEASKLE
jgi:hypothetical protein